MPELDDGVTTPVVSPDPPVTLPDTVARTDFDSQKREAVKYHRRAQDAEKSLEELKSRALSPENMEKFQVLLDQEAEAKQEAEDAEEKRLAERGEYDSVLKKLKVESAAAIQQLKESTANDIAERDQTLATMKRQLMGSAAEAPLLAAMGELAMKNTASAIRLIQDGHTRWDKAEGTDWYVGCEERPLPNGSKQMVPVVLNRVDDTVVTKNGEPITIKEFVTKFATSPEGRMRLPAVADLGTGTHIGIALSGEISYEALLGNDELRWKMQAEEPARFAKLHQAYISQKNRKEDSEKPPR